ncbi:MAG: hypothetical protein KDK91_34390, partial [Gammaproteobacteria bacterium]|nr:hypothetical protein [Gammaproteobacteria bacterium]
IKRHHIEEAIVECLDLLPNYRFFTTGSEGPLQEVGRQIILALVESPNFTITKKKVMWANWASGSEIVNKVLEALAEADNITMFTDNETGEFSIRLTQSFVERWMKKVSKENAE